MTIDELLIESQEIWGKKRMSLEEISVALAVVQGDIARQARDQHEGKAVNATELQKELGNLIFSTIRWCENLGFKPDQCIKLAKKAQTDYAHRNKQKD